MESFPKLSYPIFLIESDRLQEFTGYKVVSSRLNFTVFGRVPNSAKYSDGLLFDCEGRRYHYKGSAGWPRFSPRICALLDNLLLPGLAYKLLAAVIYFGPKPVSRQELDLNSFKSAIIGAIEDYERKPQDQLRKIVATKGGFREVIEGIEWWTYHGGSRDADGHPKDSSEHSP